MVKQKSKRDTLGAATDNPVALASRAMREVKQAEQAGDRDGMRQAAEKSWLAICSLADVAADRLGRPAPGGASARMATLRALEQQAKLRRGTYTLAFEAGRRALHGECFHGDECPNNLTELVEDFHDTVKHGVETINRLVRQKRK